MAMVGKCIADTLRISRLRAAHVCGPCSELLRALCLLLRIATSACASHTLSSIVALHAQDLFQEGNRVRCLVTFVDEASHKISLSTADLEEVDGDMILNQVYAEDLPIAERRYRQNGILALGIAVFALLIGSEVDGDMIPNQVHAAHSPFAKRRSIRRHYRARLDSSLRSASRPLNDSIELFDPQCSSTSASVTYLVPTYCSAMTGVLLHAGEGPGSCR